MQFYVYNININNVTDNKKWMDKNKNGTQKRTGQV